MHEWLVCNNIMAEMPRRQYSVEAQEVDEAPLRNRELIGSMQILICYQPLLQIQFFCFRLSGWGHFSICREIRTLSKCRVTWALLYPFQPNSSIHVCFKLDLIHGTNLMHACSTTHSIRLSRTLWKLTNWRLHPAWRLRYLERYRH